MRTVILLLLIASAFFLEAEILTYDKVINNLKGIKEYENEDYQSSEELFNENSVNNPLDGRLHYNKANSQYKSGKLEEAEQEYNLALRDNSFLDRSEAFHNLGNVKFQQQDYKEAIKHYRNALVEDSSNLDARYNYELASRFLQQQQEQQQQSQDSQESDEQNEEEQQQQQQQQQQNDEDKDEEKQEQQQQQQQEDDQDSKEEEQQQQDMKEDEKKKEEAEQMLKTLLQKEKEEMKKQKKKMNVDKSKVGKYW